MVKPSTLTLAAHLGKQVVLPGAAPADGPLKSRIADFVRAGEPRQFFKRAGEHNFVADAVVGRAKGPAHRMIDKDCAGRRDFTHDIVRRADHHGRNTLAFDDMGDETDGLMAERSIGHEQREVDLGAFEIFGKRFR